VDQQRDRAVHHLAMRLAKEFFIEIDDRWFLSTVLVDLPRRVYEQGRYLAEVLELAGRDEESDRTVAEALALYERKGMTASARRMDSRRLMR
jgi:hypothetical protein